MKLAVKARIICVAVAAFFTPPVNAWKLAGVIEIGGAGGQLGETVANSIDRGARLAGDVAAKAVERVAEGKPIDAALMWQIDLYRGQEQIALGAVQQSDVLRIAAQTTATVYLGPAGSAAFSTWYVGRTTGSFEAGARAGLISGLSSLAQSHIAAADVSMLEKAGASGLAGGTSSHLAGGSFDQGFASSSIASLGNSIYKDYTRQEMRGMPGGKAVGKAAADDSAAAAICRQTIDCTIVSSAEDMRKLSPNINHIGKFSVNPAEPATFAHEGSSFMKVVNQVPYMNAMAYLHDILAIDAGWESGFALVSTIPPSMVYVYYSTGAETLDAQLKAQTPNSTSQPNREPPVAIVARERHFKEPNPRLAN